MVKQHRVNRSKAGYFLNCLFIVFPVLFVGILQKRSRLSFPFVNPYSCGYPCTKYAHTHAPRCASSMLSMFMSKPSIVPDAYHPKCEDLRAVPANTQSSSMLPRLSVLKRTKCTNKDRLFFDGYLLNTLLVEGLQYAMVRCSDVCFHSMLQMVMKGNGTKL